MKIDIGLSPVIVGAATIVLVQPQSVLALNASQVAAIAEQISVRIDGQAPGSGVLLARQDQTYFVLTAAHVVATEDEYEIVTPDNQRYPLVYSQVKKLPGVDLAVVQFNSAKTYQLTNLGDSNQAKRGTVAYVAGWPKGGVAINQPTLLFQQGILSASSQVQQDYGYGLIYTNNTLPGMSGGPVLNAEGLLIGIHGRGETDRLQRTQDPVIVVKVGYNLGVPINTFLALVPKTGLNLGLKNVAIPSAPSTPSAPSGPSAPVASSPRIDDLIAQGSNKLHQGDYTAALQILNRAIETDPSVADAYRLRADARMSAIGWSFLEGRSKNNRDKVLAAQDDLNEAIRLNPNLSEAFAIRAYLRFVLKDESGATADIKEALRINPNNTTSYILRANLLTEKGKWRNAITEANRALELDPNSAFTAFAYNARGIGLAGTGDLSGGLQDLTQAIQLAPNNSLFYMNRGTLRAKMGDTQGGMTDLEKGANLAVEKGHTAVYEETVKIMNLIRRLR